LVCSNGESGNRNIICGIKHGGKKYTSKILLRKAKCLTATECGKTRDTFESYTELASSLKSRKFP
jgi:hypothetical protein